MTHTTGSVPDAHRRDTAGVLAAPPILLGAALVVGFALQAVRPLRLVSSAGWPLRLAGAALIVPGLLLSLAVVRAFGRAGTAVTPYRATTRLVRAGPYRYSRNPDYIGQTLLYAGIAIAANSWWPLVLLPFVLLLIHVGVIRREERYLESLFGEEYRDYSARVPRWLPRPSRTPRGRG